MKINWIMFFSIAILLFFLSNCTRQSNIVTYPNPEGIASSKKYQVFVNNKASFVYEAPVFFELNNPNRTCAFTQFDFSGRVNIVVVVNNTDIQSVRIRPASYDIKYTLNDNKISFELNEPRKVSIEINGDIDDNLVIFANEHEVNVPSPTDNNVAYFESGKVNKSEFKDKSTLYFAPGIHYVDGEYGILRLNSNQTIYLAGGAVLRARIKAENARNIKIIGRGIIEGSTLLGRQPDYYRQYMGEPDTVKRPFFIHFKNCSNIEVDGVILNDAPFWTLVFSSCSDVKVDNIKVLGYVDNSDGINVVGSKDVSVNDVFVRNNDDCIAIKGMPGDVENVSVTNSVFWTDRAVAMQIGHETLMNNIRNVHFSNIDILEQRNRYIGHYAMGIFNGDSAVISDITYENIRVENCERLISLIVEKGFYNTSPKRGRIENIHFKNIYSAKTADIHMYGFDEKHAVQNITFENLYLNNKPAEPEIFTNLYVYNITLKNTGQKAFHFESIIAEDIKYFPIDIGPWCNRSRIDRIADDGEGWLDLGPENDMKEIKSGLNHFTGIPFYISENPEKGAIILRSGQHLTNQPYASYPIKINQKFDYLFFLQATAFTDDFVKKIPPEVWIGGAGKLKFNQSPIGTTLWYYVVRYKEDGAEIKIPVKAGLNVEDWEIWAPGGWVAPLNGKKFFIQKWDNPYPDKTVETVKMYSSVQPEVPILMAITIGKRQ